MRNGLLFASGLLCLSLSYFPVGIAMAQSVPQPKIETPNVATLDKFEDIPVDMATGTPNISIPIHTLHYGNISVPISLRYHPGALRLAQHPGWVGMGWDLESGGVITRVVRLAPDEYNGTAYPQPVASTYYPESISNPPPSGAQIVNTLANWYNISALDSLFSYSAEPFPTDVCADEFFFNFMGHSGKFYYSGPTLGWQVVCDENIQVQLNSTPFVSGDQVQSTLYNLYNTAANQYHLLVNETTVPEESATQVFSGFTLTVPDGTKYYFGGVVNGNGIGIEFYTNYNQNAVQFNANTWLLTKIVDVDGNEVDFNYSASYPVANLGVGFNASNWNCQAISGGFLGSNFAALWQFPEPINLTQYGGTLTLPLYLDNITCPNETVSFSRQVATCLREANNVYYYNPSNSATKWGILALLYDGKTVTINGQPTTIYGPNNLQWMQLNNIVITDGNGAPGAVGPNGIGQIYRQYSFSYSSSTTQRLTLQAFQEFDNTNTAIQKYSFSYNSPQNLPPTYDGDQTDHWGFYNSEQLSGVSPGNADGTTGSIYNAKQPLGTTELTGLLTQINYPTGGQTLLSWDPHDYSQVVTSTAIASRSQLTNQPSNTTGGGARIREIQTKLSNGTVAHDKIYKYVRGYTNANPNNLTSSGVLNGIPTYFMTLSNRYGVHQNIQESIQVVSLNSLSVYSYNSEGAYLGYDQVVELNEDNSYTINYFTSYGPDLNLISHWDAQPLATAGWLTTDNYYTLSELDMERGKPIGIFKYNPSDKLVESTVNTYRSDAARFNNYVKYYTLNNSYSGCAAYDALLLATANQRFTYSYYVVSKNVTTYDQNGKNPQAVTTNYQYNAYNLVSTKTEINSKGETIQTTYKYPPDMTDATSQAMTAAHILSPILQTTVTNNTVPVTTATTPYYSPSAGLYKPQSVQVQIGNNPSETRQSFYTYDSRGNLNELSKTNDIHEVYLWGYFQQYPVAKITGATWSQVNQYVTQTQINNVTNVAVAGTSGATIDQNLRNLLKPLQADLPSALVTIYTYLPISGVTSETDPRGRLTYYQYDNFQRLQMITDNENNVLKTFSYQYAIPQ